MIALTLIVSSILVPTMHIYMVYINRNASLRVYYQDWSLDDILTRMNINIYRIAEGWIILFLATSIFLMNQTSETIYMYIASLYVFLFLGAHILSDIYPSPLVTYVIKNMVVRGHKISFYARYIPLFVRLLIVRLSASFFYERQEPFLIFAEKINKADRIYELHKYKEKIDEQINALKKEINETYVKTHIIPMAVLVYCFLIIANSSIIVVANDAGIFNLDEKLQSPLQITYTYIMTITRIGPELLIPKTDHERMFALFVIIQLILATVGYFGLVIGIIKQEHTNTKQPILEFKKNLKAEIELFEHQFEHDTLGKNIDHWDDEFGSYSQMEFLLNRIRREYGLPDDNK